MKRSLPFFGFLALALAAGCSPSKGGINYGSAGDGNGGSNGGSASGGGGAGQGAGGTGGDLFGTGGGTTGSTGTGPECVSSADEDKDMDGYSVAQGDCNDCDANVSPGSIEVATEMGKDEADEDCDGTVDNVAPACDDGIALGDTDPKNGARAVDLCQFINAGDPKWGVLEAKYVRADGSSGVPPAALQYGIMDSFGPNVNVQGGKRMLALSSGHARTAAQPGACGSLTCTANSPGTAPPGFPQDVPNCPGSMEINDDVALELKVRSPRNATGYSFNFKFYSFEYPEWVCTSFNDQFISLVNPAPMGSISGNVSFDKQNNPVSVNVAFFDVCSGCALGDAELAGTGFDSWDDAGGTGWLKTQAPVKGGDEITIRYAIWDTGDQAWDSTALVDNFQWVANGGTVVVGTDPIPDPK